MAKITLKQGDRLEVCLDGTDGEFVIEYGDSALTVTADLPDSDGREGVIYSERFGDTDDDSEEVEALSDLRPLLSRSQSQDCRSVGLWREPFRTVTYADDHGGGSWSYKSQFVRNLRIVQDTIQQKLMRGIERCPCCGKADTIREYELGGWTWHGQLDHSVIAHGAKPQSLAFIRFINDKSQAILRSQS